MFLYGVAAGAVFLILLMLLLLMVWKTKSQCERNKARRTETVETEEYDDYRPPCKPASGVAETQNARQHEVVGVNNKEPAYENVVRNASDTSRENSAEGNPPPYPEAIKNGNENSDADDLEDVAPFGKSAKSHKGYQHLKKTEDKQHPLYENCSEPGAHGLLSEGRMYMHLILETNQRSDSANLISTNATKKINAKPSHSKASFPKEQETELPRETGTQSRPSSAAYVNAHMGKLFCNFHQKQTK